MIVRELITRLGFTMDQRGADQYDRRLRKLREDAEKSAKKVADQEALRLSRMARAEASVARLRGAQFKTIQDTERREAMLEQQRQRGRERAERHARSMERTRRNDQRAQQRHVQALAAANARAHDAQVRRDAALRQQQQAHSQRQTRALQVQAHAQQRLDMQRMNSAQRMATANARAAAFDQRQAHMRRAELLREQNILLRNRQIRQQMNTSRSGANTGGMIAGGIGAGVSGYGLMALGGRIDEMSTYSTRLNSVFDPSRSASRDAELQRISMLAGVTPATVGGVAYKTMRAAESLGVEGMNAGRAMNVTEAVGLGAALSGSSAEATNAALIQLFQGLESNRLGGEELRSVMEQTPEIARALMKGAGYSDLGEFREASRAGKITGKVMIDALEATLPELRARANQIPITFSRTFSQLGTMLNYFLLDAQKAANITGKFNAAMLALAGTMEKGMREIVANMGGWEIATEKLVAMIAGVAIPVIIRLAMTIFTYMGPLALLAAPLTMVFASLLEFARKYPNEWAAGVAKIKGALGNLVDSVLYAMGMRLKPFERSGAQTLASIPLKNKGNGVVEFDGQEFRQDSAELFQAIQRKHPELASGMEGTGGRMRVMANGKLASEVQQLPDGKKTGSAWVDILDGLATSIEDTAKWFEDMKPVFHDIRDNIRELVGLIRRIPGLGPVQRAGDFGTGTTGVLKILGGDVKGGASDLGESIWNLGLGGFLFGGTDEVSRSMQRDQQNRQQYADRLSSPYGSGFGTKTDVKIDNINVNVKEAATKESFIKAVDSAGREAIQSALGKSSSGPFVYPMENTSRATE